MNSKLSRNSLFRLEFEQLECRRVLSADPLSNLGVDSELIYDDAGRVASSTMFFDRNLDGVIEYTVQNTYTYDDAGRILTHGTNYGTGANGTWDDQTVTSFEYDGLGRVFRSVEVRGQYPMNGLRTESTYVYNEAGEYMSVTVEEDFESDGILDRRTIHTYDYDDAGDLWTLTHDFDDDADGVIDRTNVEQVGLYQMKTYSEVLDEQGRVIQGTNIYDLDRDGVADNVIIETYVYNEAGLLQTLTVDTDFLADGKLDYREINGWNYDADGNLEWATYEVDYEADGIIDESYVLPVEGSDGQGRPDGGGNDDGSDVGSHGEIFVTSPPEIAFPEFKITPEFEVHPDFEIIDWGNGVDFIGGWPVYDGPHSEAVDLEEITTTDAVVEAFVSMQGVAHPFAVAIDVKGQVDHEVALVPPASSPTLQSTLKSTSKKPNGETRIVTAGHAPSSSESGTNAQSLGTGQLEVLDKVFELFA